MDILRPQLLWIENRCYRLNAATTTSTNQPINTNEYIEDDIYGEEEDREIEYEVEEIGPNRFKTAFHVPSEFYGRIIGARAATKKRIEGETKTEIVIPKMGKKDDIKILGTTRDSVCASRRRVEMIVTGCRQKQRFTHFVGVKVTDANIRSSCLKFKEEILKSQPIRGLEEAMFITPEKLHITLTMMCLMDDVDRENAVQLLNQSRDEVITPIREKHGKIPVNIRGIEIMNDDPSEVGVLYGKVESELLQNIADELLTRFMNAGLSKRQYGRDSVKLHMTLINAKKANKCDDDDEIDKKSLIKFDARPILENFANYEFGVFEVSEIHMAIIGTIDEDGFYKSTTKIQF